MDISKVKRIPPVHSFFLHYHVYTSLWCTYKKASMSRLKVAYNHALRILRYSRSLDGTMPVIVLVSCVIHACETFYVWFHVWPG